MTALLFGILVALVTFFGLAIVIRDIRWLVLASVVNGLLWAIGVAIFA